MNKSWCKMIRSSGALCGLALAMVMLSPVSRADTVPSPLVSGTLSFTQNIQVTGAGHLSVKVADLGVPMTIVDRLTSLSFSVSNASTGSFMLFHENAGEVVMGINAAGLYSICISAIAGGTYKLGIVSWHIGFAPSSTPVPLPAGGWFLLAGVLLMATGLQRKSVNLGQGWLPPGAMAG